MLQAIATYSSQKNTPIAYSFHAQNLTACTLESPYFLALGLDQQAPDRRNPGKQGVAFLNLLSFQHSEARPLPLSRKRYPKTPGFVTLCSAPGQESLAASTPLGQVI